MKIKNLLALGLIAVVSGISTAQTYTATAGTAGSATAGTDYAEATGDGASVAVDVPLEFELPKKVAIALKDETGVFTTNTIFDGIRTVVDSYSTASIGYKAKLTSGVDSAGRVILADGPSTYSVSSMGAIYTNADNTIVEFSAQKEFIHEDGIANGALEGVCWAHAWNGITDGYDMIPGDTGQGMACTDNTTWGAIVGPLGIDMSKISSTGNAFAFKIRMGILASSLEPTDRAGKYLSTATITVSTL